MTDKDRNKLTLMSFVNYCAANPNLRFWQALAEWAEVDNVMVGKLDFKNQITAKVQDTFYWEGRRQ